MSRLNRRDEATVKLDVCIDHHRYCPYLLLSKIFPIKQLLLTFAAGTLLPIQITLLAVVTLLPALAPKATLPLPVPLNASARLPTAVLSPVVLFISAL
jgi:hypothetical protein